jgi:hypothetical protein
MIEIDWLNCADPALLFQHLGDRGGDRKRRLFGCACCRRIWPLHILRSRQAVDVAERYADGRASRLDLGGAALELVRADAIARTVGPAAVEAANAASRCTLPLADAAGASRHVLAAVNLHAGYAARDDETIDQCVLLRDIVGNPFREVVFDPSWLRWRNGTLPSMARGIYEECRFEELPILADALEDAGCDHADILDHCRKEGPHVRGCWVIDLLLDNP